MTIVQLEYLLAVVNCGSFSRASQQCFVTQPSLSMQVKNLEEELGVVLLDRSKKPVVPTRAGEIVAQRAREALRAYEMVRESVEQLRGSISGRLRLGVIPTVAPYLLPELLPEFTAAYPEVELEVSEMVTGDIVAALDRDALDAALVAGGTCPDRFAEYELFDDRFYAYVSGHSPLCDRSNIRIEDIDPGKLLLLSEEHCLRGQILELCQSYRGRVHGGCVFASGSLETLMRLADNTDMITVVPEKTLPYIPAGKRGQVKTLARGAASRRIAAVVRRTYAKESLIGALRETVAGLKRGSPAAV